MQLYSRGLEREIEGERGEEGSELVQQQRLTNYLWNYCIHSHLKRNLSEAACSTACNTAPCLLSPLSLPLTYDGLSLMQIYNHFICRCLPCPSGNIPQHHASRCPPQNTLHHRPPLNLAFHKSQQNKDKCSDFGCLNIVPQRNTFNMMLRACVNALRCAYTSVAISLLSCAFGNIMNVTKDSHLWLLFSFFTPFILYLGWSVLYSLLCCKWIQNCGLKWRGHYIFYCHMGKCFLLWGLLSFRDSLLIGLNCTSCPE